mgnify:CR=1 FL=1
MERDRKSDVSELFHALAINENFKAKFLDPATRLSAIEEGLPGMHGRFEMSERELEALLSIGEVKNLGDLAIKFIEKTTGQKFELP